MAFSVRQLHDRAMQRAQEMDLLTRRHAAPARIRRVACVAFWLERCAAQQLPVDPACEPSRAILYRSAAWLAVRAGKYAEALVCARAGLAGVIHDDIRAELEEVFEEAERLQGEVND